MLTTRDAARLLAAVRQTDDLSALTHALGFSPPVPLGRRARERFFRPGGSGRSHAAAPELPFTGRVSVAAAGHDGTLRALLVEWNGPAPSTLRTRLASLNRALPREAPDLRWLVVAIDRQGGSLVIAAPGGAGPRTSALTVELDHVMESDAETLAALAACGLATGDADLLVHLRWRETLGREALTRRFYRDLEHRVHVLASTAAGPRVDDADRRTIALLHVSRLLFLAFLEAKGWLDRDRSFLRRAFEARSGGRGAHERMLHPLFFGTLNTPTARRAPSASAFGRVPFLNGGLFTRTPLEARHRALRFTDDALGDVIIGLLGNYRLTAREASAEWSDAAVDPEMLGHAFESLMGAADRRAHGAFYTPRPLIERLTDQALGPEPLRADPAALARLDHLRVLDPACGSGAFLVHALERLAERRRNAGDTRDLPLRRRHVLARSIFGVDVDPTAVWLCQLRLWLSVVVEDETLEPWWLAPLPNLDRNIREGDALAGGMPISRADATMPVGPFVDAPADRSLESLRLRYVRASGARKRSLGRALDRAERQRAVAAAEREIARVDAERRDLLLSVRSRDLFRERRAPDAVTRRTLLALRAAARAARTSLRRLRDGAALPFSFGTHFPEASRAGGFGVVLGNPPWVRPHALAPAMREALRARFFAYRCAAWPDGAAAAAAGRGFASQADLSALFTERAVQLAVPGGVVALLLPAKLWIALAGGGVRRLLAEHAPPLAIETWHGGTAGFDAVVYPSALVARVGPASTQPAAADAPPEVDAPDEVALAVHHDATRTSPRGAPDTWRIPRESLALDRSPGAPWLLLSRAARAAFDRIAAAGVPLASSALGRPILGVKTGCNDAFIVPATAGVDASMLRPLLRGEDLRAWRIARTRARILWTHDDGGEPLRALPRAALDHLRPWRSRLERRTDGRGERWWALFRTEAARTDRARVVWGDIGRTVRAAVLEPDDRTVPLNTCYVVRTALPDDAYALATLLNSGVMLAWLGVLAEPARGGYRRFLGWTCARLPVPCDWLAARALLAPIARAAAGGETPDDAEVTDAVLRAYGLARADVAALTDG